MRATSIVGFGYRTLTACITIPAAAAFVTQHGDARLWAFVAACGAASGFCASKVAQKAMEEAGEMRRELAESRAVAETLAQGLVGTDPGDTLADEDFGEIMANSCEACGCQRTSHDRERCSGCALIGHHPPGHTYIPMRGNER